MGWCYFWFLACNGTDTSSMQQFAASSSGDYGGVILPTAVMTINEKTQKMLPKTGGPPEKSFVCSLKFCGLVCHGLKLRRKKHNPLSQHWCVRFSTRAQLETFLCLCLHQSATTSWPTFFGRSARLLCCLGIMTPRAQ